MIRPPPGRKNSERISAPAERQEVNLTFVKKLESVHRNKSAPPKAKAERRDRFRHTGYGVPMNCHSLLASQGLRDCLLRHPAGKSFSARVSEIPVPPILKRKRGSEVPSGSGAVRKAALGEMPASSSSPPPPMEGPPLRSETSLDLAVEACLVEGIGQLLGTEISVYLEGGGSLDCVVAGDTRH